MKLTRLEHIPDEVDEKLFEALHTVMDFENPLNECRYTADVLRNLAKQAELKGTLSFVWNDNNDKLQLSAFGILNGIFMHYCPGYRLMVTEAKNEGMHHEPRRIWVCKEEE